MNHEAKVQDGTNSVWSDSVRTERMTVQDGTNEVQRKPAQPRIKA